MSKKILQTGNTVKALLTDANDNFTELYNKASQLETDIAEAGQVDDVKVNGTSVVANKVANISVPLTGVKKHDGTSLSISNGAVTLPEYATPESVTEAKAIAEGRARSVSFATIEEMRTSLNAAPKTEYKIGDNIFITATDVPDWWISAVNATSTQATNPTNTFFELPTFSVGYYTIAKLETQKVNLENYAPKTFVMQMMNALKPQKQSVTVASTSGAETAYGAFKGTASGVVLSVLQADGLEICVQKKEKNFYVDKSGTYNVIYLTSE